jgi:hypothetical protein
LTKPPGAGFAAPVIPRPASAAGVGLFGAGLGSLIGLTVGSGEKWEAIDPARLHVSVTPSTGGRAGVGLALSLAF